MGGRWEVTSYARDEIPAPDIVDLTVEHGTVPV
jgi:hypothetical protein